MSLLHLALYMLHVGEGGGRKIGYLFVGLWQECGEMRMGVEDLLLSVHARSMLGVGKQRQIKPAVRLTRSMYFFSPPACACKSLDYL